MAQRQTSGRPGEMHETIETTALTDRGGATVGTEKVCCACGKNVSGQKRFKDAEGRYWCYDCGVEDHVRKHPEDGIACAGCGEKLAPSKLTEFDKQVYCEPCVTKKKAAKKREESRIAAAAEDARHQQKVHKLMLVGVAVAVVVACGLAVWRVMF